MIIIEKSPLGMLDISFKYYPDYINRIKQVGAKFNPDTKTWTTTPDKIDELEDIFEGELYYKTPKWEITGEEAPDYSKAYEFNVNCNMDSIGFKLKPFNYQSFGIKFLVDRLVNKGMAFIADDVGLGKTLQAIGAMKYLIDNKDINNIVVVCKKSLKQQWKDEINKFISFDGDIYIADDNKKKRMKVYNEIANSSNRTLLIINYHLLLNDSSYINADMVIYDEIHTAKKVGGELNKGCSAIAKGADYCLFMTGTPIMSRPDDIYGIINIKSDTYFGKYSQFEKRYLTKYFNGSYTTNVGYKNIDELRDKVQNIILRRTANEVTIDLPEVITIDKYCTKDKVQEECLIIAEAKHDEMQEMLDKYIEKVNLFKESDNSDLYTKYKLMADKIESQMKGLIAVEQAIANSPLLFRFSKSKGVKEIYYNVTPNEKYMSNKMTTLVDICEEIKDAERKVVIFSKYETVVDYVVGLLNKNKMGAVSYSGSLNDESREKSISEFKNNPEITAIVGTDAMAEGLNLQIANTIINVDLPFNQAILNQRTGRVRRAGSNYKTATVYNLLTEDTIDTAIYTKIKDSENTFDSFISSNKAQSKALKRLSN